MRKPNFLPLILWVFLLNFYVDKPNTLRLIPIAYLRITKIKTDINLFSMYTYTLTH